MKAIHFICLTATLLPLLASCGGGGGSGKIQLIPPGDNHNQQTPPPSSFWGDPFIGVWQIHGSGAEIWIEGTGVIPNPWPRISSVTIQREGDALKATLESGLGSFTGWNSLVLADYEWLVDEEQLNPGGPSGVSYIEITSQETASYGNVDWPLLTMKWYDSDVLVGDWTDSYYYDISSMHPRRWDEVLSLAFTPVTPDDPLYNGYYWETYLGYQ